MIKKKPVLAAIWILIALITIASVVALIVFPQWKGLFLAGSGCFLVLNLLLSIFFINKNFRG